MKRAVGSASPMLRLAAPAAALATLYFVTAALTDALIEGPGIAVLWPASGVYLGVMLVAPHRMWRALALGAGVGSLAAYLHAGSSLEVSIAFAVPSSAEGLLGALLVERIAGRRFTLDGLRDLYALVVGSAVVANALVGLSAAAVAAQTFNASFLESWLRWWSADALGVIAVAPIITAPLARAWRARSQRQLGDVVVVLAGVGCAVSYAAWSKPAGAATLVGGAIALPFLLLAGWRWGPRAAAVGGLGVALVATHVAVGGTDLVTGAGDVGGQVYIVQAFLGVLLLSSLAFAAVAGDTKRLRDELGRAREGSAGELEQAHGRSAQLTAEVAARSAELAHAGSRLERLAADLRASHEARARTKQELGGARSALVAAKQEIEQLARELSLAVADRDRMQSELDDSARALRSVETKLGGTAEELARARADRRALEEALESARGDIRTLQVELESARGDIRTLQEELEGARGDTRTLQEELESARADTRTLQEELEGARADQARTAAELAEAAAGRRRVEHELAEATSGRRHVEQELAEATSGRRHVEQELDVLKRRVEGLSGQLQRAQREHEQAELALEHTRARFAERQEHLQRSLDEANVNVTRAEAERSRLADRANDLSARYDERGTCLYASPAFARLLGYEPEELVGRPGATLLHPDDRSRLAQARAARSHSTFEGRLRRKAGDLVWVEVSLDPIWTSREERPIGLKTTVREISGRRAADVQPFSVRHTETAA